MILTWFSKITEWGQSLDAKWELAQSAGQVFSAFALSELKHHRFHENFNLQNDVSEILGTNNFPTQANPHSKFGEPPLTLYMSRDQSFYVDLYIWTESQTAIHEHAFEGAFTVLEGHSIVSEYEFNQIKPLGPSFIGELSKKSLCYLSSGDVLPILLDSLTIHRVLHLSKLTVSLVLRTSKSVKIQKSYNFGVLASNGFPPGEIVAKLRVLSWFLKDGNTPQYKMIESLIPYAQLWILLASHPQSAVLLTKLARLHSQKMLEAIREEILFNHIFFELKTEEEKILFAVYEFYRVNWLDRLEAEIPRTFINPLERLCQSVKSITNLNEEKLKSPLLRQLIESR